MSDKVYTDFEEELADLLDWVEARRDVDVTINHDGSVDISARCGSLAKSPNPLAGLREAKKAYKRTLIHQMPEEILELCRIEFEKDDESIGATAAAGNHMPVRKPERKP